MYVSVNFDDKTSVIKNRLRIFDINDNVTDDVFNLFNLDDESIKNEDYIKRELIKLNFLSKYNSDRFCRNYFWNFQCVKILKYEVS